MVEQVTSGPVVERAHVLSGGGDMGALMRGLDWAATPLGSPANWAQSLQSAVSIMLNSRYPIALYWGPELALLYNDAWSPILGGKHPWALGRPGREVWPEIWDTIGPLYDKVRSTGEGVWQEDELLPMLRHGYLEECYYNFTFSPVRGEDGGIDGIFNAVVETTDRVLSERRLRTLSRMGERASASLDVEGACAWASGILAQNRTDVPFALVYLRAGDGAQLVAASGIEAGSSAAPCSLPLNGDLASIWPLAEAERAGQAMVIGPPDGENLQSAFWLEAIAEVVVVPIATAGEDRPAAFLVAGANPRRRVDATYRSFFELAAGHIGTALTTARAYEDERRRAQALAEIDRAKTAFFSNVSHEFRTPLTLMLAPLEDALAAAETAEQRERLDVAHRNALRLLRLVNSLLDFSRIEAGRVEAIFRPTDLAALTADLASSFRSATDRAGLRLLVDTPPLSRPAYADRDMWEKIVLNLVSNAFKFTHEGEIAVALREVDGSAVLTVRDTGTGIPAAELPRLFDRFHRVEGAQGRSYEGSGIGLALVHELVGVHGGTIGVASEEGVGTTFTVTLPLGTAHLPAERVLADADRDAGAVRAQAFVEEAMRWLPGEDGSDALLGAGAARDVPIDDLAPTQAGLAGARVLVADDNADLRDYIARLLTEAGYEVATARDGEAAHALLIKHRPDLLITDVMMPRLDGFGLLRRVRENGALRDLPVIMLSARAGEEAKVEGLDAGADDYLVKPFSARELSARVAANIKLARLRREAAEAVRASEELNRRILASSADCIKVLDLDGRIEFMSEGGCKSLEVDDLGAVLGLSWPDFWEAEEHEQVVRVVDLARKGETGRFQGFAATAKGNPRWWDVVVTPIIGADGRPEKLLAISRDVTETREAEERLRELNANLEQRVADALAEKRIFADLFEATDAAVQAIDLNYRFMAINAAGQADYERVFGVRPEVGDCLLDVLSHVPDQREAAHRVWARVLGGEAFVDTAWWGGDGHERRAYDMRFGPLLDGEGRQIGAYLLGQDVTERWREQERLVAAEEALRQSQKMEAIGQLTGGVAHDFNNLLTPILGSLDMLQRTGLGGGREQRLVGAALQSAERARTLVQRLLAFARRQPLQSVPVDIARLVADMGDLVASTTGPQIRVVVDAPEGLPPAQADPNQLEMALLNLAVNARDAMPDGGTLRISVGAETVGPGQQAGLGPGRYVRVSVADTGAGMDEATLARAVEPFFSTKGVGKGTGLGLSMVHGLASQLGGALTIRSQPGLGTHVELWLPESVEQLGLADTRPQPLPEAAGKGTALLVDDEELVRMSTADMLVDLGYAVVEAASAEEAMQLVDGGGSFDLVVTDHLMPGMTGTDLARAIRSVRPGVPVLLVSGYAEREGIDPDLPCLTKPFRKDELVTSLAQIAA